MAGKPILGIAAGASLLVAGGLIPGVSSELPALACFTSDANARATQTAALTEDYQRNVFTRHLTPGTYFHVVDEKETFRFAVTEALFLEMRAQGLDVLRYNGESPSPRDAIASLANKRGNVMAMPSFPDDALLEALLQSARDAIQAGDLPSVTSPLFYEPKRMHASCQ